MDHQPSTAEAVKKRLGMQNEILKRVEELAERMQRRADEVTGEVRDLEGRAGAAERDLRGAFDAFRRLSDTHFVENIVSEEEQTSCLKDCSKTSVDRSVPAQSYEMDILPRYKEAVSLGLASYKDHMKRMNKKYPTSSTFNARSLRGPLPHIIGSEEYIHDNSCGLIEDLVFGASFDFNDREESRGTYADAEPNVLFNSNLFGPEQLIPEKDGNEPLVSAASDFKAMLEAALRSPYKFYDEGSSSHAIDLDNTQTAYTDQVTPASHDVRIGSSQLLQGSDGTTMPIFEGNLNCVEGSDMHTHNISALISGSLFDTEETTLGGQEQSEDISDLVKRATCGYAFVADEVSTEHPTSSSTQRNLGSDDHSSTRHCSPVASLGSIVETGQQEAFLESVDAIEEAITRETDTIPLDNIIEENRSSTIDDNNVPDVSTENFISKLNSKEPETSGVSQSLLEHVEEKHPWPSGDTQGCQISSSQGVDDSSTLTSQCSTGPYGQH